VIVLLMALAVAVPAPAAAEPVKEPALVTYHCGDLVMAGRLQNLGYEGVDIEGDIIGHGWVTARVRVRRVLYGRTKRRSVPVRYFSHTYRRDDLELVFVINPNGAEGNQLRSAHRMIFGRPPPLARSCT
jgi:hypothetical protein